MPASTLSHPATLSPYPPVVTESDLDPAPEYLRPPVPPMSLSGTFVPGSVAFQSFCLFVRSLHCHCWRQSLGPMRHPSRPKCSPI